MRGSSTHVPPFRRGIAGSTPCRLALAIGSALGIAMPIGVAAGNSVITTPTGGGRDLGTVVSNPDAGKIYNVSAGKTRGDVDFNSFGRFEVASGDTVNLNLTSGANTVVNLVWDARALINGTLNSFKAGETGIGGRVVFADTHGLVVGANGVLNVGSLAVATPTAAFMELLVSPQDSVVDAATADLLGGTMPVSSGDVTIAGRVNAGDVRIQARAIDVTGTVWVADGTGGDAFHSSVAVNAGAGEEMRLVNDGGNLLLVANETVNVDGTLTTASGDVLINGRDIAVNAGALVDAGVGGDILLTAVDRAQVQTGQAEASSSVRVDGTLRARDIAMSATTIASTEWTDPSASLATIAGNQLVEFAQRAGSELGGTVGYMAVDTRADVAIGAGAVLDASGDIDVQARTRQTIKTELTGLRGDEQRQSVLSLGALYADLDTVASARIADGARIDAGGTLDVSAQTDNSLDVSVTSFATDGTLAAMTLALSDVDVAAEARVEEGVLLNVGGLRVGALNRSDLSTTATAHSDEAGAVGLAAAISLQDVRADAFVGSDVTARGDVVIEAASLVSRNATTASISEPPDDESPDETEGNDASGGDAVAGLFGKAFDALSGVIGSQGAGDDGSGQSSPAPFRLGSAMTFTEGSHAASARLGDGATVLAGGDFTVHANVVDAGIAITARSAIDAKGENPDNPGSPLSLSAGVALTDLQHAATAEIGKGADVTAKRIGVGADVVLPMDLSKLQDAIPDFSSFGAFMESMTAAKAAASSPWELFTSYVGAKSKADDVAIGGTINHYRVTNRTQAWVGDGATLTSTAPAGAGAGAWETALAGDARKTAWDQAVTIRALTDSLSLHSAGELGLGMPVGVGQGGAAVGGSFNNVVYDTRTIAGIARDTVVVSNGGVAVDASTRDNIVSLALMAGGGGSIGINGTLALLDVASVTHASVSRDADITAARVDVDAFQDLFVWSVSGALSMSDSLSVGLGVGVHNLRTDTRAFVGDNRADALDAPAGLVPVTGVAGSGTLRVDDLSVQARSQGMAGAVAVAGAVAKSSAPAAPNAKPGAIDKLKTSAQTKTDSLRGQAADSFTSLPGLSMLTDKVRGEQGAPASQQQPSQPKFGITVSGSASVNLIGQDTTASLDGAHVTGRNGADTSVDVAAINDTTLVSASGSAAITLAKADSSKFSAAIGGAVSFAQIDNTTDAHIEASTLETAHQVAVHALTGGEQTNVALGVSINKSTDQQSAVAIAGSFSIGQSSNSTRAWIDDSALTGGIGSDRALDVTAYNRSRIGIGAGSLYFGGRGGIGAAFTLARIADSTEASIDGGTVSGYDDVSLRALDATRIVAGAAMAGGGGESNGLGGAVVLNQVGNNTRARIAGGAALDVDGELLVQARSTAPVAAFEQRLSSVADNPDSSFDYRGDALEIDADDVQSSLTGAGSSIIAVAGLVQAGKNNIGLSFVGNDVKNRHTVEVANATLQVGDAARLDAADSTAILGISFGVGVSTDKFAGMGNATANAIDNRTDVLIGDADAVSDSTLIEAGALHATASDSSFIGSLAGNIVVGSKAAAGAAVTYNHIGNQTTVSAQRTRIDTDGATDLVATNAATIVAGAIAGSVGNNAAISGSFAWSDIGNLTRASLGDSQVEAQRLAVQAKSDSDIFTLSGSVAVSGTAAIGAAINIARIADTTEAELDDVRVAVDDDIHVEAAGSGIARSLAVAGAVSGNVSVAGSSSTAQVDNTIGARVNGLRGVGQSGAAADALSVRARNTGEAHSLAGAISGSNSAAVGGAISTNLIGGATTAALTDSVLAVREDVAVEASSRALVNTLAGAGSASSVGIAGTLTTNVVSRATRATLADTSLADPDTDTVVRATDGSQINSIAGSLGFGTSVGVGAAIAVNTISSDVTAQVLGGSHARRYHGRNLLVDASADNGGHAGGNINTVAAGIGGGGAVGGAASVAVNLIDGNVTAEIADAADVVAEHNIGVLASNQQGINVLAGSLGVSFGPAGIGLGTVVNMMEGTTRARVTGADTQVSALAKDRDDRLQVDDGLLANVALSDLGAIGDYVAPDMGGGVREVTGLAVNASTRQQVTTLGASAAFAGKAAVAVMAGASIVGGRTEALIDGARINRHPDFQLVIDPADGIDPGALDLQMVDVRASSHVVGANLLAGIAGAGLFGGAGALATNVFQGETVAGIRNADLAALQQVAVEANASQNALVIAAGLAGGLVGAAGSGVVNLFNAETTAFVSGGTLSARGLSIDAANRNASSLNAGAAAGGGVAAAGALIVNVSQSRTQARLGETGRDTDVSTRGDVRVSASADTDVNGIAVSGAAAGASGIAGMAQINVIGNQVDAGIVDADVDAKGAISVLASEHLALQAYSGALGVGLIGSGVGAGASIAVLGSKVLASVAGSALVAFDDVTVAASSERQVDMVTMTGGAGMTTGIGGAANLLLSGVGAAGDSGSELGGTMAALDALGSDGKIDARALDGVVDAGRLASLEEDARLQLTGVMGGRQDQVIARIVDSQVDAADVAVTADTALSTRSITGGVGLGGLGVGGAFAFTGLYGETIATIEQSTPGATTVAARGGVTVSARSRDGVSGAAAEIEAYAGGAGLAGLGAAVAVARVDQEVRAHAGGTLTGNGALSLRAEDTGSIEVEAIGAAAGAAALGIVVADARRSSTVEAVLLGGASVDGFTSLQVAARGAGAVSAYGLGASGGLAVAGTGVGVTAQDDTRVIATIGDDASVNTSAGTSVRADAVQNVSASGKGAAVSAGVGLGAVVVNANSAADLQARVGDRATFAGKGGLEIDAVLAQAGSNGVRADSVAGSGGLYLSVNASSASAQNNASVLAEAGRGLRTPAGDLRIAASSTTGQLASATGMSVGGVAAGAVLVSAGSNTTTRARLGDNALHAHMADAFSGTLLVQAVSSDSNVAQATAGSGGIVAGNAAKAATDSIANVSATIGNGVALAASVIDVHAEHQSNYGGSADSRNAAVVGGSGAIVTHDANAAVHAGIGANSDLLASQNIDVLALNRFGSIGESTASAAGGGVINGSAAGITTTLSGRTTANVGADTTLMSGLGGGAAFAGDISIVAATTADTRDTAELSTGGAIDVAVANSRVNADFNNAVAIGSNAQLDSRGYVNIGTYTQAGLQSTALVNTWGLAAVGVSRSDVDVIDRQSVDIGVGATTASLRNTYVVAGSDALGLRDSRIGVVSRSEGYVRGLIAVPSSSADVDVDSMTRTTLAKDSSVLSASNVTVGAADTQLNLSASGIGRGYQLGFIPTTQRSSSVTGRAEGDLAINGSVVAGRYNELDIVINANGDMQLNAGLPVVAERYTNFDMDSFLSGLCGANAALDGCKAIEALSNLIGGGTTNALVMDPLFAAGGDVFLDASRITGTGSVTAKGAPTISVVNHSDYHLLLSAIEIPDNPGGNVNFVGAADQAGNVQVHEAPSNQLASVLIHNTAGTGPAILAMEDITNISGRVILRNDFGSIGQFGTVYAAQQEVYAPNGIVSFTNRNADWFSGSNPRSSWRFALRDSFPGSYANATNPDYAVVVIANAQYGGNSQQDLYNNLYYRAPTSGGSGGSGTSLVLFGGCLHGANGGQNNSADGCTGGPFGTFQTRYTGNDGKGAHMPAIPFLDAGYFQRKVSSYDQNPAVAANAAASSFTGQQIYVEARYIDVNSRISAGAGTNWSLQVNDSAALDLWLADMERYVGTGVRQIPGYLLSVVGAGSRKIGASYDIVNRRIVVDNVNASGGGYVHLDGNIVSTTPYGVVEVSSGFGKVQIDSQIDRAVQLQDINVGSGQTGVVTIIDRLKSGTAHGDPYTVWYVNESGKATRAVDNRNGATTYDDARAVAVNQNYYDPTAGTRYQWRDEAYVRRADRYGNWYWVNQNGQRVDDGQEWQNISQGFYNAGANAAQMGVYESTISGGFTRFSSGSIAYSCKDSGWCSYGYDIGYDGQRVTPTGSGGAYGKGQVSWNFMAPLNGYLRTDSSVKADNRISINFLGSSHGLVDVDVGGDLFLDGRIYNPGGLTQLGTTASQSGGAGDIIRTSERAMVTARRLEIDAAGGVGVRGLGDLLVTLGEEGGLVAGASQRGIHVRSRSNAGVNLDVRSDAPVDIVSGSASQGYGNVNLIANGDIRGLNPGAAVDITGGDITLESRFGGIGSVTRPLRLRAYESFLSDNSLVGGVVRAVANGDIGLRDRAGDFWVGSVASRFGDVYLDAADGSLLDASLRLSSDGLSQEQIDRVRDRLGLYGNGVDASIEAYERRIMASYDEYWQLRGIGQVVAGSFVPNASAIPLFRAIAEANLGAQGISDQQVLDYLRDRFAGIEDTFAAEFGVQWQTRPEFATHDSSFAYVIAPGSERHDALSRNAVWTAAQLRYSINANALRPSGGSVGDAEPTVSGRNIRLDARDDIGRLATDLDIDYASLLAGTLNEQDALTLALANAPGDVTIIHRDGRELTVADLAALTQDEIDGGAIAFVRVKRTSPLFIEASGTFAGTAGGSAFVQGRGDLALAGLEVGEAARLAASGNIVGALGFAGPVLTTGGDLVLSAGGGLGRAGTTAAQDAMLDVAVGGRLVSATAGQHVLLRQTTGDLHVGSVFANGRLGLDVADGSLLSYLDDIALNGRNVALSASGHIAGEAADGSLRALKLNVGPDGRLDANAGGRIWLSSPEQSLTIGALTAGERIDLLVEGGALTADSLVARAGALNAAAWGDLRVGLASAAQGVTLTSLGALMAGEVEGSDALLVAADEISVGSVDVDGNATLQAGGAVRLDVDGAILASDVDIDAASLDMGAGSRIEAVSGVAIRTDGDQVIGRIAAAGGAAGGRIDLNAGGHIRGNGDDVTHISGGANVDASLLAGTGIGDAPQALRVSVGGRLDGASTTGDLDLDLPDGATIGSLTADAGSIRIDAGDSLAFGRIAAAHALRITGTGIEGDTAEVGIEGLVINALDHIAIDVLQVAGDAQLVSGSATALGTATIGGNLASVAGGMFSSDVLTVGGNADLAAADIAIIDGTVVGNATLASAASTTLGRLDVGQALMLDAGTDLGADTVTVDADATITAGLDATIDTLSVGGNIVLDAGRALTLGTATVLGNATLASSTTTTLGTLDVGQALMLDAGTDLVADTVTVGGDATIAAGQDALVDTLSVGGELALDAGRALLLGNATVLGDATLSSGTDTTIDLLEVGRTLIATAGQDLTVETGKVAGDATLQVARHLTAETLLVEGDLVAVAGGTLSSDALEVGGNADLAAADIAIIDGAVVKNATLASLASTTLGTLDVGQVLLLDTGADLIADTVTVGADATIATGQDATIDTLSVGGELALNAGRALMLGTATVLGDATLSSGTDTTIETIDVGRTLIATAGQDLTIETGKVAGDATLQAARDLTAQTLSVGRDAQLEAGRNVVFDSLSSGGDLQVSARDGDIVGTTAMVGGAATLDAGHDLLVEHVDAADRVDMVAAHDVRVGTLAARGTDVRVDAGHDIDANAIDAARDVLLTAGNAIRFGQIRAGRDIAADAGTTLTFDTLEAARDLRLRSRQAQISGDAISVGRDAVLEAATSVAVNASSVGRQFNVGAGDAIDLTRYTVGGRTQLDAGGDIRIETARGTGTQHWNAGGDIAFGEVQGASAVHMDARGGTLQGALLEAPEAYLAARDRIGLDMARIDSRLDLASADILADVVQTGTGTDPISMVLTGYEGGVARRVELSVDARDAWIMDRLAAVQAELDTTVAKVDIVDGRIEQQMRLTTPVTRTWMHNQDPTLRDVDLQMTEPGMNFMLSQRGNHTFTDAYVVRYGEGFWVEAPNHLAPHDWTDVDYYAESALRFTFRTLEGDLWAHQGLALHPFAAWQRTPEPKNDPVEPVYGAVNTGISP